MKNNIKKSILTGVTFLSLGLLAACSTPASSNLNSQQTTQTTQTTNSQISNLQDVKLSSSIDWTSLPTKNITLSNETLNITEGGTYVISGKTEAGIKVNTEANVRLILAGTEISSPDTAAIYVEKADNVELNLQNGSTNIIKDSSTHKDTNIEGAIHVEADLFITGEGSLDVQANFQDGIVSTDDLVIENGKINIKSVDDGIRGKDSLTIVNGDITVDAKGDGIKSNNDTDASKGNLLIKGGNINISSGDDGIKAEQAVVIDGGTINIPKSVEAIEGTNVTINGGQINTYSTDDGVNAASTNTGANMFIRITGGDITVEVGPGDTDAFDSNGNIYITGGKVNAIGQTSRFDADGTIEFTGGTVFENGTQVSQISQRGARGGARR